MKVQTIAVGKQMFVTRKVLKTLVDPQSSAYMLVEPNASEKFRFFRSIVGKHAKKSWKVCIDNFPAGEDVYAFHRD
jgi:hypothetical protein